MLLVRLADARPGLFVLALLAAAVAGALLRRWWWPRLCVRWRRWRRVYRTSLAEQLADSEVVSAAALPAFLEPYAHLPASTSMHEVSTAASLPAVASPARTMSELLADEGDSPPPPRMLAPGAPPVASSPLDADRGAPGPASPAMLQDN